MCPLPDLAAGASRCLRAAAALTLAVVVLHADEFDVLRQKWVDLTTGGSSYDVDDPIIASGIASITSTANSYWSSLDKSASRTALWADAASTTVSADINTNYSRLRSMALAYATTGSTLRGNTALRDDIISGLDWMYARRYNETVRIYDNWWHFEIGAPMALNDTVALMYDDLSAAQIANYMRAVDKFTPNATTPAPGGSTGTFTGANRMWKIQVVAIRGLIVKDEAKLRGARDAFSNLFLYVTSGDGFYTDGSFVQHGKHPYTGGYGASLLGTIAPMLTLLNGPNTLSAEGSSWRVTDPNLANVYRWVYDSYEPLIYRGGMMAMVDGREVSRSSSSEHGTGHSILQSILRISQFAPAADRARMRSMLRYWAESDTSRSFVGSAPLALKPDAQQLMNDPALLPRGELRGNFLFPSMDRVVHLGSGFGLGLALSSTRIYTYESINGENLHGWYTGDGMAYLYNGDLTHFSDAYWPTVNPRRLPGTTVDAAQARSNGSGQSVAPSPTWAGGASLGEYGVAGMQLAGWSNTLRAKKSWFLFPDQIVCLGADINSSDNRTIETTVENRLLSSTGNNTVTIDGAAAPTTLGWSSTVAAARWAHLAGRVSDSDVGYFFPGGAILRALREARTGAWSDINTGGAATPITRNYLTLWFDHGASPSGATYAYILLPGRTAAQVAAYGAKPDIAVLENSSAVQAVRGLGLTAANFWTDTKTTVGGLSSDRKAAVVVQEGNGFIALGASDPTQANATGLTIEYAASAQSVVQADPGVTITQLTPTIRMVVDVAGARGRTFHARLATANGKPPAVLTNLSTRAFVPSRDAALIAGFVITGSGEKPLLIRGVGPTLTTFGLTGALSNPRVTVVDAAGATIAQNDDWSTNAAELTAAFAATGAFPFAAGSRDAAMIVRLPAGGYSALVNDTQATGGGIALLEVYDLAPGAAPRLSNLSSRTFSGPGAQSAIIGFNLDGDASRQVLVRVAGPALANFGVSDALPDPQLRVTAANGTTLAQNDNWSASPVVADIAATGTRVGAFAFSPGKDAAALVTLGRGAYTAVVTDTANRSGTALVELFAVP